jgi:hypothetical protein
MKAGRQQNIATLAVRAFFESQFAESMDQRQVSQNFLERTISRELEEVTYQPASIR